MSTVASNYEALTQLTSVPSFRDDKEDDDDNEPSNLIYMYPSVKKQLLGGCATNVLSTDVICCNNYSSDPCSMQTGRHILDMSSVDAPYARGYQLNTRTEMTNATDCNFLQGSAACKRYEIEKFETLIKGTS